MSTITLESVAHDLKAIREFMANIGDRRLDRREFADRLGIHPATLDRRVKAGSVPRPVDGRWPLSVILAWEESQQRGKL